MSDYYQDPRLSASKLKNYLQHDPAIAHHMETAPSFSTSDALRHGTALHAMMEGQTVTVSPHDSFRTKEAKAWKAEHPDFLTASEFETIEHWHNSVIDTLMTKHERLYNAYKAGEYEKEFFTDTHKAKLDCIHDGIICDWKSSRHTNGHDVVREFQRYGAALQAAHYADISGASEFHFVVVSKTAPYPCWVLTCSEATLEYGRQLRSKAETIRSDYMNGLGGDALVLDPPAWASQGEDDEAVEW